MKKKQILIVEDEALTGLDVHNILQNIGYDVPEVLTSGKELLEKIDKLNPDLIISDINLQGGINGIDAIEQVKVNYDIPIIYLTALSSNEIFEQSQKTDPCGYLLKPVGRNDLYTAIETALHRHELVKRLKESENKYKQLIEGSSQIIFQITEDGIFDLLNIAGANQLGGKPVDFIGKSMWDLFPKELADSQMKDICKVIKTTT